MPSSTYHIHLFKNNYHLKLAFGDGKAAKM